MFFPDSSSCSYSEASSDFTEFLLFKMYWSFLFVSAGSTVIVPQVQLSGHDQFLYNDPPSPRPGKQSAHVRSEIASKYNISKKAGNRAFKKRKHRAGQLNAADGDQKRNHRPDNFQQSPQSHRRIVSSLFKRAHLSNNELFGHAKSPYAGNTSRTSSRSHLNESKTAGAIYNAEAQSDTTEPREFYVNLADYIAVDEEDKLEAEEEGGGGREGGEETEKQSELTRPRKSLTEPERFAIHAPKQQSVRVNDVNDSKEIASSLHQLQNSYIPYVNRDNSLTSNAKHLKSNGGRYSVENGQKTERNLLGHLGSRSNFIWSHTSVRREGHETDDRLSERKYESAQRAVEHEQLRQANLRDHINDQVIVEGGEEEKGIGQADLTLYASNEKDPDSHATKLRHLSKKNLSPYDRNAQLLLFDQLPKPPAPGQHQKEKETYGDRAKHVHHLESKGDHGMIGYNASSNKELVAKRDMNEMVKRVLLPLSIHETGRYFPREEKIDMKRDDNQLHNYRHKAESYDRASENRKGAITMTHINKPPTTVTPPTQNSSLLSVNIHSNQQPQTDPHSKHGHHQHAPGSKDQNPKGKTFASFLGDYLEENLFNAEEKLGIDGKDFETLSLHDFTVMMNSSTHEGRVPPLSLPGFHDTKKETAMNQIKRYLHRRNSTGEQQKSSGYTAYSVARALTLPNDGSFVVLEGNIDPPTCKY